MQDKMIFIAIVPSSQHFPAITPYDALVLTDAFRKKCRTKLMEFGKEELVKKKARGDEKSAY